MLSYQFFLVLLTKEKKKDIILNNKSEDEKKYPFSRFPESPRLVKEVKRNDEIHLGALHRTVALTGSTK